MGIKILESRWSIYNEREESQHNIVEFSLTYELDIFNRRIFEWWEIGESSVKKLLFHFTKSNITYLGNLVGNKIIGIAINGAGETWNFEASYLGDSLDLIRKKAFKAFSKNNFEISVKLLEKWFSQNTKPFIHKEIEIYFKSILRLNNPDVNIEEYPLWIRLNESKEKYYKRLELAYNSFGDKDENERIKLSKQLVSKFSFAEDKDVIKLSRYNLKDAIDFGIWEGYTIEEIMKFDPAYILNSIIDKDCFYLNSELLLRKEFNNKSDFYKAIEYNFIKSKIIDKWWKIESKYTIKKNRNRLL